MQKATILFFTLLFLSNCQNNPKLQEKAKPTEAKPDYTKDLRLTNQNFQFSEMIDFDSTVIKFMRNWEMKGASLAILQDGKLKYAKGYGFADFEQKVKTEPYHLFRIASVSKLVTAVAIMKLIEEGKISLESQVFGKKGILNDTNFLDIKHTNTYKIKIKHLLTHTGGWRNIFRTDPMFVPLLVAEHMEVKSPPSLETTIRFMLTQNVDFEPGTLYDYSNFGYCVLGKVVEKISNMPYEEYLQKEILNPLGITGMKLSKTRRKDRAFNEVKYYTHQNESKRLSVFNTGDSALRTYDGTYMEALGAAGGWIATPTDLLKLTVAIDGLNSKPDILKKEIVKEMMTPKDSINDNLVLGWKKCNTMYCWRTGSLAGTGIVLMAQKNGLAWVLVTNTSAWRGPGFSYEIEAMMRRALVKISKWRENDFFENAYKK